MSEPYVGEIKIFGFTYAPRNYAFAAGQLLPVNQNTTLFSLITNAFGGNGSTNFALPNLASRHACGDGQSAGNTQRNRAAAFGTFAVALDTTQMPSHTHALSAYRPGNPADLAAVPTATAAIGHSGFGTFDAFAPAGQSQAVLAADALTSEGSGSPHPNTQPYLGLNYAIALLGNYPIRP